MPDNNCSDDSAAEVVGTNVHVDNIISSSDSDNDPLSKISKVNYYISLVVS